MFDFAWSEIALIGVVALVAIGPKDMPVAIRTVARAVKKARSMAAEFQTHVDEMVREADLGEVKDQINSLRRMDIKGNLVRAVDSDGAIRRTLRDDPFQNAPPAQDAVPHDEPTVLPALDHEVQAIETRPEHLISPPQADQPSADPVAPLKADDKGPGEDTHRPQPPASSSSQSQD